MRVLLLGSSGLLGHNVLKLLVDHHFQVRCLLRRSINFPFPTPGVEFLQGSLLSDLDLRNAASGCDAIINCAGTTDMSLLYLEDYYPVNRDLCGRLTSLLEADDQLRTLVHVSTANTIGYGSPNHLATESDPMQEPFLHSFYALSKQAGEQLLQSAAKRLTNKHIIILNPGFMVGPYDYKPSSGELLLSAYKLPIMFAPKGGKSFVPVVDVASAVISALSSGQSGHRYLLTGDNLSLKEFYQLQAQVCGYRQKVLSLPNFFALAAAKLGDLLRLCGIRTQLSSRNVRQLLIREYYDSSLAHHDLAFPQPCPAEPASLSIASSRHVEFISASLSTAIRDFFSHH